MRSLLVLVSTALRCGPARNILDIARFLPRGEYSITVVSMSTDPVDNLRREFQAAGCECICLSLDGPRRWFVGEAITNLLVKRRPDILLSVGMRPQLYGGPIGARCGVPAQITVVWETLSEAYRLDYGAVRGRLAWSGVRRALKRYFHRVVANATGAAEFLCARGISPEKLKVILNGVDVEHFRPAAGEARHNARKSYLGGFDGCVVAYAGSLISRKAVDDLLRAAGQLKQTGMNIRYLLIGDGKERQNLAKLARTFGLEREVIFVGHVNDVRAPLAAADVFVLPSLSEGLSCALLEGMALGLPPVVTDVSGTRDVITDESCGLVVPTRNPRAIAQALGRLLQNSDLGFKMGCSARARVLDKFSATRMAWEYHQLFQELLSPQQPRVETKVGFVDP